MQVARRCKVKAQTTKTAKVAQLTRRYAVHIVDVPGSPIQRFPLMVCSVESRFSFLNCAESLRFRVRNRWDPPFP